MAEDAIAMGGVDLADPDTYAVGMPFDAFRELRRRAPVAWHPYGDGPGFLALTGYDEVLSVSRDSATWSSQSAGLYELTEIMNSGAVGDTHADVSRVLDAQMHMFQYGTELAARKRAAPGDDIATSLLEADLDGLRE